MEGGESGAVCAYDMGQNWVKQLWLLDRHAFNIDLFDGRSSQVES